MTKEVPAGETDLTKGPEPRGEATGVSTSLSFNPPLPKWEPMPDWNGCTHA